MSANDDKILELKNQIAVKKLALKKDKFVPITNCSIELDGQRYNIHTLTEETGLLLLLKLNSLYQSAVQLGYTEVRISGYLLSDWITDLQNKLTVLNRKVDEKKLVDMEAKLTSLLSQDKKVELELQNIIGELNG